MMNADTLATALGRKNIAAALGIQPTAVSNAVVRGGFPPAWFVACKALADKAGVDCPPDLFKMMGLSGSGEAQQ